MFPKYYQLVITAIFICIEMTDNINFEDSKYSFNDSYDKNLPPLRRYGRQTAVGCTIPAQAQHTKYATLGTQGSPIRPGDFISNFVSIEISCTKGFGLNPLAQNHSICISGTWVPPLSHCSRLCSSLTSVISTNVNCMYGDIPLDQCYDAVEDTSVLLSCNSLYEDSSINNNPLSLCSDGKWDPPIRQCKPVCGQKRPLGIVNIINGGDVQRGDYPWHIGIYNSTDQGYLCGGTIIDRNIILSAAHCFTDYDGNVYGEENFLIAAGKYHRIYNHESDIYAQYSKIQKINIPERYKGLSTFHALDIAVLIIESPVSISPAVQPVCIELNQQLQSLYLSSNSIGTVTGWGFTEESGEPSDVLKEVQIPYVPYEKCFEEIPRSFRKYLNDDKICGGYLNLGTGICTGDSGGGLVFHNRVNDRFYIKGIVSTSPATVSKTCNSNQYSLYTSIAVHTKFIRNVIIRNRLHYNIECKYNKCVSKEPEEIPEDTVTTPKPQQGPASCGYFYFSCKDHKSPFRRMLEMVL